MKLWKKAVSVLLGFCMMIGGLALAPKMDVRAAGPVQVYVSPGQTVAINKTRNNIYVKDTNGACVPFTAYYYDSNGNKQGERVSSKENDSEYGKMNEAVYADFIYESVRCEQINGDYFVHIYEGEDTHPKKDTPPSDSGGSGSESCHHNFEWVTIQEATAIADAVLAYECTNCGRVTDYMKEPNSAFAQFNKESIASIETAQKDAAVTLDTDIWNSFPGSVLSALSSRPDITLVINYRYEGKRYTVTIPAGSDVLSLIDENGYCGFRTLDSWFGGSELTVG